MDIPPDAFIFMKVGNHASENFDAILERKNRERERAGCIFWGHGGTACHPLMQVQPFAQGHVSRDGVLADELVDRSSRDKEEKAANAFALELLTGTPEVRVLPMGPGRSARALAVLPSMLVFTSRLIPATSF